MDLRSLSYFVAVAEELNITKAAEKLKMSQPPLSSQIKSLENELNTVLFIRGGRRLQLTDSGKLLYRRAKEVLNLAEKASSEIISMSRGISGTISLGLIEGAAPDIAAEWIADFARKYPDVRFRITDGSSDELIDRLRSGIISLAVISAPCDNSLLNSFRVGEGRLCAVMRGDDPLTAREGDTLSVAALRGRQLNVPARRSVTDTLYKLFKQQGVEPGIVCTMDTASDALSLAEKGVGISIFPYSRVLEQSGLCVKKLSESAFALEYLFVWLKGRPLPTPEEAFIDHVKSRL